MHGADTGHLRQIGSRDAKLDLQFLECPLLLQLALLAQHDRERFDDGRFARICFSIQAYRESLPFSVALRCIAFHLKQVKQVEQMEQVRQNSPAAICLALSSCTSSIGWRKLPNRALTCLLTAVKISFGDSISRLIFLSF
jgi:hypothetical protein